MQGPHSLIGTPERVSLLRSQCLVRDHHRCVISRVFDFNEAGERILQDDNAVDDDGVPLGNQPTDVLQVAHIIPHSLMESKDKNDPKLVRFYPCGVCTSLSLLNNTHSLSRRKLLL